MAKENITDEFLRTANWAERMGDRPQIDVWDSGHRGLVMRVTAGEKLTFTWTLVCWLNGRKRRFTLGRWSTMGYKAARRAFTKLNGRVAEGHDPVAERRKRREREREIENIMTVRDVAARFLTEYRIKGRQWRPRTRYTNERMMESEVLPVIGDLVVTTVTTRHIKNLLQQIFNREEGDANAYRANRVQMLLSGLFKFAVRQEWISINPVTGVERLGAESPRDRYLSHAEIKKLWQVLGDDEHSDQVRLMLITGQRVGECMALEWGEISDGWWTIPAAKSKNHLAHRVFLGPLAMEILERRGVKATGYVFEEHDEIPAPWRDELKSKCGFEKDWQLRDLRRTVGTELAPEFGPSSVAQLLGHSDASAPRVTFVYVRSDQDPMKRRMATWWNERLAGLVAENVVEMRPVSAAPTAA